MNKNLQAGALKQFGVWGKIKLWRANNSRRRDMKSENNWNITYQQMAKSCIQKHL
jgi:hypothetical protein